MMFLQTNKQTVC